MKKMEEQQPSKEQKKPGQYNTYLKYSSLAIQWTLTIGLMTWIGYKVDQWLKTSLPWFTIFFCLAAFGGMMYQLVKAVNK